MNNNTHKQILKDFSLNNNPTKDDIAKAYYARDIDMNLTFEKQFQNAMNKLRYNPNTYQETISGKIRNKVVSITQEYLKNKEPIILNFQELENNIKNSFLETKIEKENKYTMFLQFLDNKNHLGFYQAMDKKELGYLGF
tara:strand:- start:1542 stop:1958 length:417 start_codon:yes stop_codon:yes gene_type:complete